MKALVLDTRVPTETTKHKTKIFQYATAAYMPAPPHTHTHTHGGCIIDRVPDGVSLCCTEESENSPQVPLESIPSPLKGDVPLKRATRVFKVAVSMFRCR